MSFVVKIIDFIPKDCKLIVILKAKNYSQEYRGPPGIPKGPAKLMRLGPTNRIVHDSDSKAVDFDRRFWSNSISMTIFESTIAISI